MNTHTDASGEDRRLAAGGARYGFWCWLIGATLAGGPALGGIAPATAPSGPRVDIDNPPRGVFADDWYAISFQGTKCGYMRSTMARRTDARQKRDVIETATEMRITLGRGGQSIRIGSLEKSVETIEGGIVRFSSEADMSLLKIVIRGEVQGDTIKVTTQQVGQPITRTYPLPRGALMSWGSFRQQVRRGLAPGTKYTLRGYVPSISQDRALDATYEVIREEDVDLYGRVVKAWRTRQVMKAPGLLGQSEIESTVWVDDQCTPLKLDMEVAQMRVTAIQCSRAVAVQEADPPELMAETLIPVRMPAGTENAKAVTYRIFRKSVATTGPARPLSGLPETTMQRVKQDGADLLVTVTRSGAVRADPAASRPTEAELKDLTAATPYANAKDPEIRRLAKEAAGGEKDPRALVFRLRAFVSDYVESKDLSVGFATASEVARSRQGDCSEHAVLLAALARACGLPSRCVSGVVYAQQFAGRSRVFVWHMWTQVWIEDHWVDVDAALAQDDVDATHIAMGLVTLADAGLAEMALPVWNLIGGVGIRVAAVVPSE